ncbi:MAG: hypothetical protein ACTSWR_00360 [Candidatus Helarchaeota archaeon]
MSEEIYKFFEELVRDYKILLELVPVNNNAINIITQYFPLNFEANFIISDTGEEFFIRISPESNVIKKRRNPFSIMTIITDKNTLLKIIRRQTSILREFNFQNLHISNLKQVYMYRIILLGMLIQSKAEYDNRRKILRFLPIKIIRNFLLIFLEDKSFVLIKLILKKLIPKIMGILVK